MSSDERQLWSVGPVRCVMISCCSAAELQVRLIRSSLGDGEILLRELYPSKSDLYERARTLQAEYASQWTPATE